MIHFALYMFEKSTVETKELGCIDVEISVGSALLSNA